MFSVTSAFYLILGFLQQMNKFKRNYKIGSMNLIYINETPSTNNYATGRLQTEPLEEGTVILTFRQTHGRGQATNTWESEENRNLTFSLILRPDFLPVSAQFFLSQVVSLGLADYLSSETEDVAIKWPNDILIENRKIAGILIENSILGNNIAWSVAGIGLNLNQQTFRDYLPRAVSLSNVTGRKYDPERVLNDLFSAIMSKYSLLKEGRTEIIQQQYLRKLFRVKEWCSYRAEGNTFIARATGTDEFGRLILEDQKGKLTVWPFKGVEMLWDNPGYL